MYGVIQKGLQLANMQLKQHIPWTEQLENCCPPHWAGCMKALNPHALCPPLFREKGKKNTIHHWMKRLNIYFNMYISNHEWNRLIHSSCVQGWKCRSQGQVIMEAGAFNSHRFHAVNPFSDCLVTMKRIIVINLEVAPPATVFPIMCYSVIYL